MTRAPATIRFLAGLLSPGGVLLVAAWAVQQEDVVRAAAAPYAVYFCYGALATAALLSWYHDQSRLLCIALATLFIVSGVQRWPGEPHAAKTAAVLLLPVNFILFSTLRERGVMTIDGLSKVGIVFAQAFAVASMPAEGGYAVHALMYWRPDPAAWTAMPASAQLAFALAALALVALVFRRRTKVEQGLFWALTAMFLGLSQMRTPDVLLLYAGTTGLVLVFAVLEHGFDIAYRDELTGLLGRRAFNSAVEQLGRTYAIAMCDVDHFKKFNDTYGHDAGDQVLRMVAAKLTQVGGGGQAFRYGGEEFLVVFRGRSAVEAEPFVEAVRKAIADAGFVLRGPDRPPQKPRHVERADPHGHSSVAVTISAGIAERSMRHSTAELVLEAADAALYSAKAAGRNCVRLAESVQASAILGV